MLILKNTIETFVVIDCINISIMIYLSKEDYIFY